MIDTYANKLTITQTFKNYKELCLFLQEKCKTGESKKAQLKEWERCFSYKKDGHKFIITEIYEEPKEKIDKRGGNNTKNISPMIYHILNSFGCDDFNKWYSAKYLSCDVLQVFDKDFINTYQNEKTIDYIKSKNSIYDSSIIYEYGKAIQFIFNNLFSKTIEYMNKKNLAEGTQGYTFVTTDQEETSALFTSTDSINDEIKQMETNVCNKILADKFPKCKLQGRQLKLILFNDDNDIALDMYNKMIYDEMNNCDGIIFNGVIDALTNEYDFEGYEGDIKKETIVNKYYKSYNIKSCDDSDVTDDFTTTKKLLQTKIHQLAKKFISSKTILYNGEKIKKYNNNIYYTYMDKIGKLAMPELDIEINEDNDDDLVWLLALAG